MHLDQYIVPAASHVRHDTSFIEPMSTQVQHAGHTFHEQAHSTGRRMLQRLQFAPDLGAPSLIAHRFCDSDLLGRLWVVLGLRDRCALPPQPARQQANRALLFASQMTSRDAKLLGDLFLRDLLGVTQRQQVIVAPTTRLDRDFGLRLERLDTD